MTTDDAIDSLGESKATVPEDVGSSNISSCIYATHGKLCDGSGKPLTPEQIAEVMAVYNAWRCGNLQDCTIHTSGDMSKIKW